MKTLVFALSQAVIFPQQPDIYLEVVGQPSTEAKWAFFAPHEDEKVANQYLSSQISTKGGVFAVLRQNGKREISLIVDGGIIKVDPNRIFTQAGRLASIKKLNKHATAQQTKQAELKAKALSKLILTQLGEESPNTTWVAMHNNTNGFSGDGKNGIGTISILRYQQKLKAGAGFLIDVAQHQHDEDDLFFVTEQAHFNQMKNAGWNAVLQHPNVKHDPEEDDGSLSVYAEMKGINYINIEAERHFQGVGKDHLKVQQQMIDYTFSLLQNKH